MTTQTFITPDIELIRASREAISYQATTGSARLYIEALKRELLVLNSEIGKADQLISNTLAKATVALDTDELGEELEALTALNNHELNDEIRKAIDAHSSNVSHLMKGCTSQIQTYQNAMSNSLFEVKTATISDNKYRLDELDEGRTRLNKELETEKQPLEQLKTDRDVLNAAIRIFESLTFIDRLKPLLEQLTGLIGGKPETPETAAMKAGLIVANKFLDEANELIKYTDLIKARTTVQTRMTQRMTRVISLETQIKDNEVKTKQLNDTQKVIEPRKSYVSEAGKIVESLGTFLKAVTPAQKDDVLTNGNLLMAQAGALSDYLEEIRGVWLRD